MRQSELPRRYIKKPKDSEDGKTLASMKRKRDEQLKTLDKVQDAADVASLSAAAADSSTSRAGADHEHLAKRLRKLQHEMLSPLLFHVCVLSSSSRFFDFLKLGFDSRRFHFHALRKKKQLQEDALPPGAGAVSDKLRKHLADEAKIKSNLETLEQLEYTVAAGHILPSDRTLCVVASDQDESRIETSVPGLVTVRWQNSVDQYKELAAHELIWYNHEIDKMIWADGSSSFQVASRMLGGFVAGHQWLRHCEDFGGLLRPAVQLKPTLSEMVELCFHRSVAVDSGAATAIARCVHATKNTWIIRSKWKDMQRKNGVVLVTGDVKQIASKGVDKRRLGTVMLLTDFVCRQTRWKA